jgi:hypothetical protein
VTMHPRELPGVDVVVVPALGTMTAEDTLGALAARASRVPAAAGGAADSAALRVVRGLAVAGRFPAGACRPAGWPLAVRGASAE